MIGVSDFLGAPGIILDVRSPSEYNHAHIPGSLSFPLFSDEERALVGTLYKQKGKEVAFDEGLKLVSPKLPHFVERARELALTHPLLKITCARGGMRSGAMAWLLQTAGLPTQRLEGGYKAYRQFVLSRLVKKYRFIVIGGLTGSGKTEILRALKEKGAQVIDFEAIAQHRGSSYGLKGIQPTTEHFENEIASCLHTFSRDEPIFVEDESRQVGCCKIPDILYDQKHLSPLCLINAPKEERLSRILKEYGAEDERGLIEATKRIEKRLGKENCQKAIEAIEKKDLQRAVEIILDYYDKSYRWLLEKKAPPLISLDAKESSPEFLAKEILEKVR